ncbi:protein tyrosine/serine/threonine phosphatase [Aureococcus anophagefferens]|nr:protein tyrosine/serine/threonine phosphatase [Aureococcus anophagefferens]
MLNAKLQSPELRTRSSARSSSHPHARANAAFLMGAWQVLYLGRSPEDAWKPGGRPSDVALRLHLRRHGAPLPQGLHKARRFNFFNFDAFDLAEYEHFEAVENGDLNWIVEGKKFIQMGADHIDLYYLDGSNPPMRILKKFLAVAEQATGAIGVHCKAGLGRTGTCIGCYCMKHYKFTAAEIIGWMRICRLPLMLTMHYVEGYGAERSRTASPSRATAPRTPGVRAARDAARRRARR